MKKLTLLSFILVLILSSCNGKKENGTLTLNDSNTPGGKIQEQAQSEAKQIKNKDNLPTLMFYYADWCPYCKRMLPSVLKAQKELEGRVFFYYVDADSKEGKKLSRVYRNNDGGIPYTQFYDADGNFITEALGFISYAKLMKIINKSLL